MRYKILDVRKRNSLISMFSIEKFKVTVLVEDKQLISFNAWAGVHYPTLDRLIWDVKRKLKMFFSEQKAEEIIQAAKLLEGEITED
jgi:hypothetical protein